MRATASIAVADVLTGTPRQAEVLAAFPAAAYLAHADGIVALVTTDGIAHPNAVVLAAATSDRPLARLYRGQTATLGGGTASVGDLDVSIARWFDPTPRLPAVTGGALVTRVAEARKHLAPGAPDGLVVGLGVVGDALLAGDADAAVSAAREMIGSGPGLTPAGDDLVAGLFAAVVTLSAAVTRDDGLAATGSGPLVTTLGAAAPRIVERARRATPAISAELLHHAARGEVAAPAAGVLHALVGRRALPAALDGLLAVGATSGRDLAEGLLAGAGLVLAATAAPVATSPASCAATSATSPTVPLLVPSAGAR